MSLPESRGTNSSVIDNRLQRSNVVWISVEPCIHFFRLNFDGRQVVSHPRKFWFFLVRIRATMTDQIQLNSHAALRTPLALLA